ncbi:hypothetical protein ANRL1_00236 [Anaerolineae bacterium]|nr:hypothetical protein ANRL1_00236 [Anaerolineae bacterium]
MNPAIVISAYNRPHALERILSSISQAQYVQRDVPLVISIDRGDDERNNQVAAIANQFEWKFGPKQVIHHSNHLGLLQHIFFCGGLTNTYDAVISLEDDLYVSPSFYVYASQALNFYHDDPRIAGVSLYALWFNGYTKQPFVPLADGTDGFFLQIPYTQGQAWSKRQWERFTAWRARGNTRPGRGDNLHEMWFHFDAQDHFPILTKYLVETNQYYVYSRVSLTTGFGDQGTHFSNASSFFQVPLERCKPSYHLNPFDQATSVYDSFFEIRSDRLNRLTGALRDYDYSVDLYATKSRRNIFTEYVLTSRRSRAPIRSFGKAMFPHEMNVIENIPGSEIVLCKTSDVRWDWLAEIETKKINHDYFTRKQPTSKKLWLQFALLKLLRR